MLLVFACRLFLFVDSLSLPICVAALEKTLFAFSSVPSPSSYLILFVLCHSHDTLLPASLTFFLPPSFN